VQEQDEPFVVDAEFVVGRPPDAVEGMTFACPAAMNLGPLGLPPHQRYEWRLMVDGKAHEDWRLPFYTRPPAQGQQRAA
jgi:hypothetical protein